MLRPADLHATGACSPASFPTIAPSNGFSPDPARAAASCHVDQGAGPASVFSRIAHSRATAALQPLAVQRAGKQKPSRQARAKSVGEHASKLTEVSDNQRGPATPAGLDTFTARSRSAMFDGGRRRSSSTWSRGPFLGSQELVANDTTTTRQ